MSIKKYLTILTVFLAVFMSGMIIAQPVYAAGTCGEAKDERPAVTTSIDFGCKGDGNPINDMLFAVLRFLITGVGIVVVAMVIVGGIQYTFSQGEPQNQAKARQRIMAALSALLLYVFTFAILQWLVPGGVFIL